jgi:hypothetical protein
MKKFHIIMGNYISSLFEDDEDNILTPIENPEPIKLQQVVPKKKQRKNNTKRRKRTYEDD